MTPLLDEILALKAAATTIVGSKCLDDLGSLGHVKVLGIVRCIFKDRELWDQVEWLQGQVRWSEKERADAEAQGRWLNGTS